jgi:hypothetical protein
MSDLSLVQNPLAGNGTFIPRGPNALSPLVATDARGRRPKIWDIAPSLHCSIIGTCLSAAELRQFFVRLGDANARTASDNVLHHSGVRAAGRHDLIGKLLNKALDNRHEATIRRFAKASDTTQVRGLWLEAFEQGNIPGGYWAVLTHPATDRPLIEEAFGQVHMLSHMVGSSNRIDIVRLRLRGVSANMAFIFSAHCVPIYQIGAATAVASSIRPRFSQPGSMRGRGIASIRSCV